jgi:hypothetical protein
MAAAISVKLGRLQITINLQAVHFVRRTLFRSPEATSVLVLRVSTGNIARNFARRLLAQMDAAPKLANACVMTVSQDGNAPSSHAVFQSATPWLDVKVQSGMKWGTLAKIAPLAALVVKRDRMASFVTRPLRF